jgi:hypothetical protein
MVEKTVVQQDSKKMFLTLSKLSSLLNPLKYKLSLLEETRLRHFNLEFLIEAGTKFAINTVYRDESPALDQLKRFAIIPKHFIVAKYLQ